MDALPTSVVFATGETEQTLAIVIENDDTDEADGEIVLTLTATPGAYRITGAASVRVTVTDNDLPEVSVTAGPAITEGGTAMYTVRLADAAVTGLTVPLTVDVGTYQAVDALPTSVVFAVGETEQTLAIVIVNDDTDEADGEIVLTLTATPGAYRITGAASVRVTVTDNDLPEVSVTAGPAITEGGTAMYTVRLADAAVETLTVPLTVDIGTYQAVAPLPTSVVFAIGETEQTLAIELVNDDTDEADGEIVLTLTATPGTYRITGAASARVAVTDNDLPQVSVEAGPAITEGGTAMYTVRLADAAVTGLMVPLTVDTGTYQAVDALPTNVVFAVGETEQTLAIELVNDDTDEADGEIVLTLTATPGTYRITGAASARVAVTDNDLPQVSVTAGPAITEGGTAMYTVRLADAAVTGLTVPLTVDAGTYQAVDALPTSVVFAPGETEQTLAIAIENDDTDEADGEIVLTLTATPGTYRITGAASARVAVTDNDLPQVSVTAGPAITEGGTAMFTVRLADAAVTGLTVPLTVDVGTYQAVDALPTSVVFAVGETEQTLAIVIENDDTDEADGEIVLTLTAMPGTYRITGAASARVTITDNDLPEVSVTAGPAITEGGTAMYTVRLADAAVTGLTVPLTVDTGTYQAIDALPTRVVFAVGETEQTLSIAIENDDTDEADGEIVLTLTATPGTYRIAGDASARVAVTDNDLPQVSVTAGPAITEGGTAIYTVRLASPATTGLMVLLTVNVGDYRIVGASPTSVAFAAGDTVQSVMLTIAEDNIDRSDGEAVLTISANAAYRLSGTGIARIGITDNDAQRISLAIVSDPVIEGAGEALFTLTRTTGELVTTPSVVIRIMDVGGVEVATGRGTYVTGADVLQVSITIPSDDDSEDDMLTAVLQSGTGFALGEPSRVTFTHSDPDLPVVTIALRGDATVNEGDAAGITLRRAVADEALDVVLEVVNSDGDVTDTGTCRIPSGQSESSGCAYTLRADDDIPTGDEQYTVRLASTAGVPDAQYVAGTPSSVVYTVREDDAAIVAGITAGPTPVALGTEVSFTVAASRELPPGKTAFFTVSAANQAGDVLTVSPSPSVELTAENAEQTVTVPVSSAGSVTATLQIDPAVIPVPVWYEISSVAGTASVAVVLPEVSVTAGARITEGETAMFTLRLQEPATSTRTNNVEVLCVVTVTGDYQVRGDLPTQFVFGVGETEKVALIEIDDDAIDRPFGELTFMISSGDGYAIASGGREATITIADNEIPATPKRPVALRQTVTLATDQEGAIEAGSPVTFIIDIGAAPRPSSGASLSNVHLMVDVLIRDESADTLLENRTVMLGHDETSKRFTFTPARPGTVSVRVTGRSGLNVANVDDYLINDDPITITVVSRADPLVERRMKGTEAVAVGTGRAISWGMAGTVRTRMAGRSGSGVDMGSMASRSGGLNFKDLLASGVGFDLSLGDDDDAGEGESGVSLNIWGSGSRTSIDDTSVRTRRQDGDMLSGHVGMDVEVADGILLGLAGGWHDSSIDFNDTAMDVTGSTDIELYTVNPYISRESGKLNVWATIGGGTGTLTLTELRGNRESKAKTDVSMRMAAGGVEYTLNQLGPLEIKGRGEGMVMRFNVDELADGDLAFPRINTSLHGLRGEVEASLPITRTEVIAGKVRPYVLSGLRWDGGGSGNGLAYEYGGGVEFSSKDITLDVAARSQIGGTSATDLSSYTLSLEYDSDRDGRGPTLSLSRASGMPSFDPYASVPLSDNNRSKGASIISAQAGYSVGLRHGVMTPYGLINLDQADLNTLEGGLKFKTSGGAAVLFSRYSPAETIEKENGHSVGIEIRIEF